MQKQAKHNLLLVGLLVALVALIVFLPEQGAVRVGTQLVESTPDAIAVYAIDKGNESLRYSLQRNDQQWLVTIPGSGPSIAASAQVDALLQSLRARSRRNWHRNEIPDASSGLADPKYRIDIDGRSILVGDRGALGNQRYVLDGDRILLISDILLYHLQRDPQSFLSRTTAD